MGYAVCDDGQRAATVNLYMPITHAVILTHFIPNTPVALPIHTVVRCQL